MERHDNLVADSINRRSLFLISAILAFDTENCNFTFRTQKSRVSLSVCRIYTERLSRRVNLSHWFYLFMAGPACYCGFFKELHNFHCPLST